MTRQNGTTGDAADRWKDYEPPDLPDRQVHRDARDAVTKMTSGEKRELLVSAGICNQDGSLTGRYGGRN